MSCWRKSASGRPGGVFSGTRSPSLSVAYESCRGCWTLRSRAGGTSPFVENQCQVITPESPQSIEQGHQLSQCPETTLSPWTQDIQSDDQHSLRRAKEGWTSWLKIWQMSHESCGCAEAQNKADKKCPCFSVEIAFPRFLSQPCHLSSEVATI